MVTYFLQPFNSRQSRSPNWYNVNYRRTGTYKGMGDDLNEQIASLQRDNPLPSVLSTMPWSYMPAATTPAPTTTSYLPWLLAGGLLLILLARGR